MLRRLASLVLIGPLGLGIPSLMAQIAHDPPRHLARSATYETLIGHLLAVTDFQMHYFEDGASDATVTCPEDCNMPEKAPVAAVVALMKKPSVTVPVLIDCLSDGRLTHLIFDGNAITRPMRVPVGYVCLDLLMSRFFNEPVAEYECNTDGLGACMHPRFYFRPDDYFGCVPEGCTPRPWIGIVQANWRRALRDGTIWQASKKGPENTR